MGPARRFAAQFPESLEGAFVLAAEGTLLWRRGLPEQAIPPLTRAVSVLQAIEDPESETDGYELTLVWCLIDAGRFPDAEKRLDRMLPRQEARGRDSLLVLTSWKAMAFLRLNEGKPELALPILKRISPLFHSGFGRESAHAADVDWMLGSACRQLGMTNDAVTAFASLIPVWPKIAPVYQDRCAGIAEWFAAIGRFDEAAATFSALRKSFELAPPATPGLYIDYLRSVAAGENWKAAAAACRSSPFEDSLFIQLNKACLCRTIQHDEAGGSLVENVLLAPRQNANKHERHIPIEIAAVSRCALTARQEEQLLRLISEPEADLNDLPAQTQFWARRAIGHLQIRLGHYERALRSLEAASAIQKAADPYALTLMAAAFHHLGEHEQAISAFRAAEQSPGGALAKMRSPEHQRFLHPGDFFQKVLLPGEIGALLQGAPSNSAALHP